MVQIDLAASKRFPETVKYRFFPALISSSLNHTIHILQTSQDTSTYYHYIPPPPHL